MKKLTASVLALGLMFSSAAFAGGMTNEEKAEVTATVSYDVNWGDVALGVVGLPFNLLEGFFQWLESQGVEVDYNDYPEAGYERGQ